jgi:hypothetical protein
VNSLVDIALTIALGVFLVCWWLAVIIVIVIGRMS